MSRRVVPLWSETIASIGLGLLTAAVAARMLTGCGGAPFVAVDELATAPVTVDAGELADGVHQGAPDRTNVVPDAGEVLDAPGTPDAYMGPQVHDAEPADVDAGDVLEVLEGSRIDTAPDVAVDAGAIPVDAGPPPPPPALCCMTPCQGPQTAAITCSNAPPWTCGDPSGPSCSASRCSVSSLCYWQNGSCSGRVAVCP